MAVTATQVLPPGSIKNMDTEIHTIVWTSTTATVELSTDLTEIYAAIPVMAYGADAGHTDNDLGVLEIDETSTDGVITPASGAITVNRIAAGAGTLAGQSCLLLLFGKS